MAWQELAHTLVQMVEAVKAPPASGLVVSEAEIEMPLEVGCGLHRGRLVFLARPPHSRWQAGFLPWTHRSRLKVALVAAGEGAGGMAPAETGRGA